MNDAIFKFKRYEDSSLSYTGINKHAGKDIGGWNTVIKRQEYEQLFYNQQAAMAAPMEQPADVDDLPPTILEPDREPETPVARNAFVTAQYGIEPPACAQKPERKRVDYYVSTLQSGKTEAEQMDLSWVVAGAAVSHRKFGKGEVVKPDSSKKYLTIRFDQGEKRFVFPDAFRYGFLNRAD